MTQHAITKALTPAQLILRIQDDPYDPNAPLVVSAVVWAADESVLAAHTIRLEGVERDFLDTLVTVATQAWQWGAPAQQLAPAMKRVKRDAVKHRKAHTVR